MQQQEEKQVFALNVTVLSWSLDPYYSAKQVLSEVFVKKTWWLLG